MRYGKLKGEPLADLNSPVSNGNGSIVTSGRKVVSRLWNQIQTSGTVTRKVSQVRHGASTSAQDRYLDLSPRRHRWTTALQLDCDLAVLCV
ncbi:hypothetical protein TNCV_2096251 [Trichonephila clavipes]|nr:hypothetical protein TNCV_2096251 [Trichonephila clavipes]